MSDTNVLQAQIDTLRRHTLGILEDLAEKTSQYDVARLPASVEMYRKKIAANRYNVLVVGEASRGKSSFVNALIGRKLLPTDVDVSTKQVFRVSYAHQEAYRLRFEDDTTLPINESELIAYGSQTASDQEQASAIDLDQLRWIEVEAPARYLPPNISLLDTPGLGALYAAHARITQRFIPYADAVIFVLDSRSEMGQTEEEFVRTILGVTRHIFFIQTHIDQHDAAKWQAVLDRNEAILREKFENQLDNTRVWPISSSNLLDAALTTDKNNAFYLKLSRYPELAPALDAFLFRAAGWDSCVEALKAAMYSYTESRKILTGRLAGLEATPEDERAEIPQRLAQQQTFEIQWGTQGQKRLELQSHVRTIVNTNKQSFIDLLEPHGELERQQKEKINALNSTAEANRLAESMPAQVRTDAVAKWQAVCKQANHECSLLFGSLVANIDALLLPPEDPRLIARYEPPVTFHDELADYITKLPHDFLESGNEIYTVLCLAAFLIPISWGVAAAGVAIAGIWGAARKFNLHQHSKLQEAQQALRDSLAALLQEVRSAFLQPKPVYNDISLVNHFFDSLARRMHEQIEMIVEQKRAKAQSENIHLDAQTRLDPQQRQAQARELREQLAAWDESGRAIKTTFKEFKAIEPR
jgi:GTPase SAR1 family protein